MKSLRILQMAKRDPVLLNDRVFLWNSGRIAEQYRARAILGYELRGRKSYNVKLATRGNEENPNESHTLIIFLRQLDDDRTHRTQLSQWKFAVTSCTGCPILIYKCDHLGNYSSFKKSSRMHFFLFWDGSNLVHLICFTSIDAAGYFL